MIKGLIGSAGIVVQGGDTSVPYINQNITNPMQGMMRVWGTDMQVFDGSSWMNLSTSYATVGLNSDTQSLLNWAREKRDEENKWYKLASSNEAVRIALEQLEQAKTRLELTAILSRDHETTN
jgi:hypothetical protein